MIGTWICEERWYRCTGWQRQTPMWVNIKDSFKQLFLIQDSTIHHHVLWFWNRRVQEAGVKIWLKLRVLTQAAESAERSVCALSSVIEGFTSYWKTWNPWIESWKLWQLHFKILCLNLTHRTEDEQTDHICVCLYLWTVLTLLAL